MPPSADVRNYLSMLGAALASALSAVQLLTSVLEADEGQQAAASSSAPRAIGGPSFPPAPHGAVPPPPALPAAAPRGSVPMAPRARPVLRAAAPLPDGDELAELRAAYRYRGRMDRLLSKKATSLLREHRGRPSPLPIDSSSWALFGDVAQAVLSDREVRALRPRPDEWQLWLCLRLSTGDRGARFEVQATEAGLPTTREGRAAALVRACQRPAEGTLPSFRSPDPSSTSEGAAGSGRAVRPRLH